MSDLFSAFSSLPSHAFAHILPSLDKSALTTADLLTLDPADVARRASVPAAEVRKLVDAIVRHAHAQVGLTDGRNDDDESSEGIQGREKRPKQRGVVSTLDARIDEALGGGVRTGYVTEFTGESGAGKTQFLLTLLLAVQLPPPRGLSRSALYISTEAPLSTPRLSQLLASHPYFTEPSLSLEGTQGDEEVGNDAGEASASEKPSLSRIHSMVVHDLEAQEHVIAYQLPVAVRKFGVGLVVLDSVAANFRAEFEKNGASSRGLGEGRAAAENMAKRADQLIKLGSLLRALAQDEDVAVVVANQVADRFTRETALPNHTAPTWRAPQTSAIDRQGHGLSQESNGSSTGNASQNSSSSLKPTGAANLTATPTPHLPAPASHGAGKNKDDNDSVFYTSPDPLTLDHQQRWFTGWGDESPPPTNVAHFNQHHLTPPHISTKTPSLGLIWTNQIAARVALIKEPTSVFDHSPLAEDMQNQPQQHPREHTGSDNTSSALPSRTKPPPLSRLPAERTSTAKNPPQSWHRYLKVVFAPWTPPSSLSAPVSTRAFASASSPAPTDSVPGRRTARMVEFVIEKGGIRGV